MSAAEEGHTRLFDVILEVFGDEATGGGVYDVTIVDRYRNPADIIGEHQASSLDDALEFAKGAVTAFMRDTSVND